MKESIPSSVQPAHADQKPTICPLFNGVRTTAAAFDVCIGNPPSLWTFESLFIGRRLAQRGQRLLSDFVFCISYIHERRQSTFDQSAAKPRQYHPGNLRRIENGDRRWPPGAGPGAASGNARAAFQREPHSDTRSLAPARKRRLGADRTEQRRDRLTARRRRSP